MPSHYTSSQTALLLLDFHTLFVQMASGTKGPAAASVAASMKSWAKAQGIHIIHGLIDIHSTPDPAVKGADRLSGMVSHLKQGGGGDEASILREDSDGEITFTRKLGYVSALKSPGLLEFLEEKRIKSLVLTGLSTSGCVLRTWGAAIDEGFVVTVLEDGCADREQAVHDILAGKVFGSRGWVYTAEGFREGWEKGDIGKGE
ncbi:hypothetical protein N0V90_004121 [Kalmusia sp. IMI 367209]|nr:hypothetical protein N0V90_004121 [Kalmusia sp. IMI 367209]